METLTAMKKIAILWLRQVKKYLRSKSRIIGSLGQPLLFLIALGYGFGSVFAQAGQGNYLNFLAPGIIGMGIIFTAIFSGMEVIWDRQFGFLKETLVAPMPRWQIMVGRTLGGATVATIQGLLVMILAFVAGFHPTHWLGIIPAIGVMFLIAVLFTALGTMAASVLNDMQGFHLVMNFLVFPLFFFSGALFPLTGAPTALAVIARINPLAYGIDALRALLIDGGVYGLGLDLAVLSVVTLIFLWLGTFFFQRMQIDP